MNCPRCNTGMETVQFSDVEVDRCPACNGLWFDEHEAEVLLETSGAEALDRGSQPAAPTAKAGPLVCPKCHTRMIGMAVHGQPHIRFDSCKVCFGSFFDGGEFADAKQLTFREWLGSLFPRS